MFDFFSEDHNNIKNESNGRATTAKTSFNKVVNLNKRNENFKEIISEANGFPGHQEILTFKSTGTSDTGSIFHSMMEQYGNCDELNLSTWIISRQNIEYLYQNINNGKIKQLNFIISIRQKELKKADYAYMIENFIGNPKIKYRVCNSHAKSFSAKFGDNYFTCIGSGNWTKNPRIETYMILNDKNIFLHNREWMAELL